MIRVRRCPRCRHDRLSIAEVAESVGVTDFGRVELDERSHLIRPSNFFYESGLILRVSLECEACGHCWRSRSAVSG